jgi:hypothetical protein
MATTKPRHRPRLQFSLLGLMIVTLVCAAAAAPGYYMFRGGVQLPESRLVGILMVLAGPLLLMTLVSALVALSGRGRG